MLYRIYSGKDSIITLGSLKRVSGQLSSEYPFSVRAVKNISMRRSDLDLIFKSENDAKNFIDKFSDELPDDVRIVKYKGFHGSEEDMTRMDNNGEIPCYTYDIYGLENYAKSLLEHIDNPDIKVSVSLSRQGELFIRLYGKAYNRHHVIRWINPFTGSIKNDLKPYLEQHPYPDDVEFKIFVYGLEGIHRKFKVTLK